MAWEEGQPSSAWLQQLWDLLVEHPDLRPLEGLAAAASCGPPPGQAAPSFSGASLACCWRAWMPSHLFHLLCIALVVMLAAGGQDKLAMAHSGLGEIASVALAAGCQGGQLGRGCRDCHLQAGLQAA